AGRLHARNPVGSGGFAKGRRAFLRRIDPTNAPASIQSRASSGGIDRTGTRDCGQFRRVARALTACRQTRLVCSRRTSETKSNGDEHRVRRTVVAAANFSLSSPGDSGGPLPGPPPLLRSAFAARLRRGRGSRWGARFESRGSPRNFRAHSFATLWSDVPATART